MKKYILTLDEEQANLVSAACEFYARIRMGQFGEIIYKCLDPQITAEDYCKRREKAALLLDIAREAIYPDLDGIGHSYGICKFRDADRAYDVHQVIKQAMSPGFEAWSYHKLPECEVREE